MSDYISRQAAIEVAREDGKKIPTVAIRIMHDIKALPAADVVPVVHGHWIRHDDADIVEGYYVPEYECSECKMWVKDDTDYCPYCGSFNGGEERG